MSQPCPSQERWKEHLDGNLRADEEAVLTEHLDGCAACRKTLETLAGGSDSLLGVARQAGEATEPSTPALHEVLAQFQSPKSETQAEPTGARDDSLAFLTASARPGFLGRLGPYEIQAVIGKGGFGIVLKAFDERLHRVVAIKVLTNTFAANGAARKRFIREARAAAAVKNEHVVGIHDVQEEGQPPYLVMEYIEGVSLQDKLDKAGAVGVKEILRISTQIAEGLAAAHKQGLVHRDIKPANILLENGVERVKITDFGLARAVDDASVTQSGTVAGTPMYMSPEQAEGLPIDHRSDLFSLGTVLYAMCTGHPPFRASGTHAVLKRVIDAAPRPIREINSEIPDWLCAIIAKLHAKSPGERYQTAKEVAELLGQHLAHIQQPSQTPLPHASVWSDGLDEWVKPTAQQGPAETAKSQPMSAPRLALVFWPTLIGLFLGAVAGSVLNWTNPAWLSELWGVETSPWIGVASSAGLGAWLGVLVGLMRWMVSWRISWEVRKARKNEEAGLVATASFPAAPRRPVRMAVIVLAIAAVVMVPCMIPAGIVLYILSSSSSRDPNVGVPPQEGHNLILIRDDPTVSLLVNPEQGGQNGFTFDGLEFGTVLPAGRYQVQGRKNDVLVFQQWVTLNANQTKTLHVYSGWVQLFNGKDLTGWKTHPTQPGDWQVENGNLVGSARKTSFLFSERGDFENFHLRFEAKLNPQGNSGVFVCAPFGLPFATNAGSIPGGFQAQFGANDSTVTAGALRYVGPKPSLTTVDVPTDTWFSEEIIAQGERIILKVNGVTTTDFRDPERKFIKGHIALQVIKDTGSVQFRKIEIKELAPVGAPPLAVAPFDQQKAKTHQDAWAKHLGVESEITNSIGMRLRLIPPGEFRMGSSPEEIAWLLKEVPDLKDASDNVRSEGPQRRVTVKEPFYMGVHEVTVGHFSEFVRATKYRTEAETDQGGIMWNNDLKKWERKPENVWNNVELFGEDTHPVVFVTLTDAQAFCAWLTKREGRAYAVPAEEQWEWACRAGATTRWFFGDDAVAMKNFGWTTPLSKGKMKPVGRLAPNPFGLYDIYGNANELTMNLQQQAVGRGGEAGESPHRARSTSRFVIEKQYDPSYRRGFRVVIVGDLRAKAPTSQTWMPLFNGKDLTGWTNPKQAFGPWKVDNGLLIGKGDQAFLRTERGPYDDFHLRMEAKYVGSRAGLLLREQSPDVAGAGYQCMMENNMKGDFNTGAVALMHTKSGMGHMAIPTQVLTQRDQWFTLEVIASGNRLETFVDGKKAVDFVDIHSEFMEGFIGLIVWGKESELHIKKIEIKKLPLGQRGWIHIFNGTDLNGWNSAQRNKWKVENGALVGLAQGTLTTNQEYRNFHCRIKAKFNAESMGSVVFGGKADLHAEVRIGDKVEAVKTGSLLLHSKPKTETIVAREKQLIPPDTWFDLEILVSGKKVTVRVNGTTTAEKHLETLPKGFHPIGLHAIEPGTVITVSKIEIKELPPED
jgi:serine/threonine protein kinase/formylglycine-generating enzyme required for sulfatase activity